MANRRTSDNPEENVKNYQLEITNTKIDTIKTSVDTLNKSVIDFQNLLQQVMQTRPTNEQVDDRIAVMAANLTKDMDTLGRELRLELGPPVKTSNRLLWALLASGLSILVAMATVILGFFSTGGKM